MATVRNIAIRLSVQDNETVRRALEQLGEDGKRALARIEQDSAAGSKGLLALSNAADVARRGIIAAGVGITAAATGLGFMIKNAVDTADRLNDLSKSTGVAVETLSGLDLVAKQSGTSIDSVARAVGIMSRNMAATPDKFRAFGISLQEIKSGSISSQEALARVADVLSRMPDGLQKSALAAAALGRGAQEMIPFLNEGGDAIRNASGVITSDFANAADGFNDNLAKINQQVLGISAGLAEALLPAITDIANKFSDPAFQNDLKSFAEFLVDTTKAAVENAKAIGLIVAGLSGLRAGAAVGALAVPFAGPAAPFVGAAVGAAGGAGAALLAMNAAGDALDSYKGKVSELEVLNTRIEAQERTIAQIRTVTNGANVKELENHQRILDRLIERRDEMSAKPAPPIVAFSGDVTDLDGKKAEATAKRLAAEEKKRLEEKEKLQQQIFKIEEARYDLASEADKKDDENSRNLQEYITGIERQIHLNGLSVDARAEEVAVLNAIKLVQNDLVEGEEKLLAGDEARIRALAKQQVAQEAAQKAAEESAQEWNRIWDQASDNIQDSLAGAFRSALDGSLKSSKDFAKAFKSLMLDTIAQIAAAMVFKPVIGGIFNAIGLGSGAASGGGGSGALGLAANGASLGNFLSGGSLTSGVGNFLFGSPAIGVAAGAQGPILPATSGLLASGGFAGSGLATALPIAGAVVASLSLLRGFGVIGPGKSVGPNAGGQLIEQGGVFAVGPTGADNGGNVAGVTQELTQAAQVLNALAQGIGVAQIGDGLASYIDTFGAGGIRNAADLIKDAIAKGVIEGLTEGEKSLIAASQDLNATAQQIITNRLVPGQLAARRREIEDPLGFALDAAQTQYDVLVTQLTGIGATAQALEDARFLFDRQGADIRERLTPVEAPAEATVEAPANNIVPFPSHLIYNNSGPSAADVLAEFAAARLSLEDPEQFARNALEAERDGMIARLKEVRGGVEGLADIEAIYQFKLKEITERFATDSGDAIIDAANDNLDFFANQINSIYINAGNAAQSLQDTADSLKAFLDVLDSGPLSSLSSRDQLNIARAKFAADPNEASARTLLELSQQFAPGIGFARDSANVRQTLGNAVAATPGRIAAIHAEAAASAAALAAAQAAQRENGRLALAAAAASEGFWNARRFGDDAAQAAFAASLSDEIKAMLPEFGGAPRFANGGITPVNRPFIVGERGPEIMRMNVPGVVTSNADAFGAAPEIRALRGQIERLERVMISMAAKTVDMENRQRKWDTTGLLTRTA